MTKHFPDPGADQKQYAERGYAVLGAVATADVVRTLTAIISSDMQSQPGARQRHLVKPTISKKPAYEFYGYHYPLAVGFHWGLTGYLSTLTGKRLAPTYSYFRAYQHGDVCIVHSDRPACEHSLSMPLAYSNDIIWDFNIGPRWREEKEALTVQSAPDFGNDDYTTVKLAPGDAILYRGVNLRHGRITPNPNAWSAHLFLHWVDLDGPYREWAYDKQPMPSSAAFSFQA